MTSEKTAALLDRIAHAINRIEGASHALAQRKSAEADRALEKLQSQHDHLRGETKKALSELDTLIATIESGARG